MYLRMLHTIALSVNLSNVECAGKMWWLGDARQSFLHHQHDGVVKIKSRKELRSRYAKFMCYNHNHIVRD